MNSRQNRERIRLAQTTKHNEGLIQQYRGNEPDEDCETSGFKPQEGDRFTVEEGLI